VRAQPPGIASGQTSTIDALLGQKGGTTGVATPTLATVVSPASLSDVLTGDGTHWTVTAPDETRLAAARTELKLAAGAPVPLQISVAYAGGSLVALKSIDLGVAAENPPMNNVTIDGKPAPDPGTELTVGKLVKIPLSIDADDITYDVTWLTSCGTMHDFDLPQSYLRVEADDPDAGQLAVVIRDAHGGVSWKLWPIHAQ
jgi:hypothetical protein